MVWKVLLGGMLAAALLAPGPGLAGVKVRFVNPGRYTDAGGFGETGATLAAFRGYFERLGQRFLDPHDDLTIDVLDIDLAGQFEPVGRGFSEVRVLRGATPPRFRLRYVLSERGKRRLSGEDDLGDINYQMTPRTSTDSYAYEKAMLADWFKSRFSRAGR